MVIGLVCIGYARSCLVSLVAIEYGLVKRFGFSLGKARLFRGRQVDHGRFKVGHGSPSFIMIGSSWSRDVEFGLDSAVAG